MTFFRHPTLLISYLIPLCILAPEIPNWSLAIAAAALFARLLVDFSKLKLPPRWLINIIGLILFLITYLQYKTLFGRDSSTAIVAALSALKILEMREDKDLDFVWILTLVLVSLNFLYSFDLIQVILAFASTMLLFYSLLNPKGLEDKSYRYPKLLFKTVLYSVPVATFLFLFFPRTQSPFFKPAPYEAKTGFSDSLKPGRIAELTESNNLVFRATFKNKPEAKDLYWVGEYLTRPNDLEWSKTDRRKFKKQKQENEVNDFPRTTYQVSVEPSQSQYLFPLKNTEKIESQENIHQIDNEIFRTNNYNRERFVFTGTLTLASENNLLENPDPYLEVPEVSQKISEWLGLATKISAQEAIKNLEAKLLGEGFQYTLSPGQDSSNLEDFLYKGKKGFCEHFAALGATVLRHHGIPSRIGVGYSGGDYNSVGNFVSVREKHAHAWVEYYDQGWKIWDITQIFAPMVGLATFKAKSGFNLSDLMLQFEYLNFQFTEFMLNFNSENQFKELKNIKAYLLYGILFFIVVYILIAAIKPKQKKQDWIEIEIIKLLKWGQRQGFAKEDQQSLESFINQINLKVPQISESLSKLLLAYQKTRYFNQPLSSVEKFKLQLPKAF